MTKRFLALFLGLTLALSLLPQPIRAAAPVDYLPPDPDFGVEFHLRTPSVAGRLTLGEDGKTATLFAPNTTRESGWKDADKNWSNDAALCWAASCSNVLSWYLQFAELEGWLTSGQYENNHDRIFDQFRANWPDLSGQDPVTGMSWYFTAGFPSGGPPAENPPSPGSGGYLRALFPDCEMWSKLNFMQPTSFLFGDYATMTPFLDSEDGSYYDYQPLYNHRSFSDTVIRQLHYGPTVLTIGKENAGPQSTHAVTMWGCDYDEATKLVSAIYLTDSDDSQDLLRRIPIKARPGDQGGIRMEGYYPLVGGDARPYTNIVCTDLLFPMNAVYLGDAPTEPTVPVTPVEPSSVSLNQTSLALKKDNSFLLTASVSPAEAENQTVTWNSDAPQIASVDSSGLVTAHCPGQTVITATTWNGHSASCTVTVLPTEVSSIRLNRTSLSLTRKDTFQLSATVSPADADNQNITWISDTPGVASVSRDGLVTAVAAGEARITASADNGQSASCVVTVEPIEVTSVELNRSELSLTRKDTFQLSATVSPADADSQNITWTSDTPGVASVARDGLVTAVAAGKARITASADNGQSASCVVTVRPIGVASVTLNQETLVLGRNERFRLSASITPADADNREITWKSEIPGIASVTPEGVVRGVSVGSTVITATAPNGVSASCRVTVELRNPFVDVTDSAYYFAPVLWAVDTGITTGTDATHFSPDAPCTRKQIVTFLWRASGSPAPASTYNPFVDVPHDSFEQAILWAVEMGITSGVDSRHFAPNAPCTRAQAVTFLWRSCGSPRKSGNSFADVPAVSFYAQAVRWAVDNEITEGTDAVHFSPDWICSRGQIVTFLYRMNRH